MKTSKPQFIDKAKNVHMIGIGGISMSGLAQILSAMGCSVSGSDMKSSSRTEKLKELGIKIYEGHNEQNIQNPDLVVYSAAIKPDNPEYKKAKELNIPLIDRASLLGDIMTYYKYPVAVSGTHGKTTTTSMISLVLLEAGLNPTIHVGAEIKSLGDATKLGGYEYFIVEACEYTGSFLKFKPFAEIILNIEFDHADYFKNLDHVKSTFEQFTTIADDNGFIIGCADDKNVVEVLRKSNKKCIFFAIENPHAEWLAKDIEYNEIGCASYTLVNQDCDLGRVSLSVPGRHNILNSLAAISCCHYLGCPVDSAIKTLSSFTGAERRFEYKGSFNGVKIIDDYAHHPSEIEATLKTAKKICKKDVWCIFQPHTYSRTKHLLDEFSRALRLADKVIICDIYAAREKDPGDINSSMLVDKINKCGGNALYIQKFENIKDYIVKHVHAEDIVITMGAGDIDNVASLLLKNTH